MDDCQSRTAESIHQLRKRQRQGESEIASDGHIPACCFSVEGDEPAAVLYAKYNSAGDPNTAGKNFEGDPCPVWEDLPPNIHAKWRAVAGHHRPGSFGWALAQLESGSRVYRRGWNGRDMWLILIRAGNAMHTSLAGSFEMRDCIGIKTAQGDMQPGWRPTQLDMFALDWGRM